MATLLELRRRVRSVKNMRQITRAMKLVAGAKLRRAQEAMLAARPYSDKLWEVLGDLAQAGERPVEHPLLTPRPERRVTAVVITSDRGLCGAFNSNVIKYTHRALEVWRDQREVTLLAVGRKGWDHFRRTGARVERADGDLLKDLSFPRAAAVARDLIDRFTRGETDAVYLVYNEFVSALRQNLVIEPLVPIHELPLPKDAGVTFKQAARAYAEAATGGHVHEAFRAIGALATELAEADEEMRRFIAAHDEPVELVEFLYEPDPQAVLEQLLPRFVEAQLYRALLESSAAEHAARMAAMDNATKNAEELIADLTLTMNKLRQEAITTEILEVVGGAEALQ